MATLYQNIINEFGTPLYLYNGDKTIQQFQKIQNAFPDVKLKIKYAMKALNNINILKLLRSQGAGIDAVSIQEVYLALRAGYKPHEIIFTPNSIGFEELTEAIDQGVQINIDNLTLLEKFGAKYQHNYPCCIRINPHIMAGGNANISVGHIDSKFGVSIHQIRHVERIVKNYGIHVNGLHMHTGSDILDADIFLLGAEIIFQAARSFDKLNFIDFGSGFKVAYKDGDIETDIDKVGSIISRAFKEFCENYGRELELWFEPGKFIVSASGELLVKSNVVKQTTSTVFVGVDSGQNHLLRPMMYNAYHEIENITNLKGDKKLYTIVGNICETDTFGYDRFLNEVREGDILSIKNAGAYGFSMSNQYNSRPRPAEVLVLNGKYYLIRRRENMEDLTRNEIELSSDCLSAL